MTNETSDQQSAVPSTLFRTWRGASLDMKVSNPVFIAIDLRWTDGFRNVRAVPSYTWPLIHEDGREVA